MKILITNDDGIFAPGLCALTQTFRKAGHEIYLCAPSHQRSAASHSVTLTRALTAEKLQIPGTKAAWSVDGTPADCVRLALNHLCPDMDVVLSGINHGANAGIDVLYSGTVAAAMEGALTGKRAIAVSLDVSKEDTYHLAAELALSVMEKTMHVQLPDYSVLNINYPAADRALGLKAVPLRLTRYQNHFIETVLTSAVSEYRLDAALEELAEHDESDYSWLRRGYATLTVLSHNTTDRESTLRLGSLLSLT